MSALIPLAMSLVPELGTILSGPDAQAAIEAVDIAVQGVTGTPDPAQAAASLARDPQLAARLRVQLVRIAAMPPAPEQSAGARGQQQALAQARNAIAYGPPIVSLVVLLTFAMVLWLTLADGVPKGAETIVNMLLGTLAAMATSVVSYWVGSSVGSARKDAIITAPRA